MQITNINIQCNIKQLMYRQMKTKMLMCVWVGACMRACVRACESGQNNHIRTHMVFLKSNANDTFHKFIFSLLSFMVFAIRYPEEKYIVSVTFNAYSQR